VIQSSDNDDLGESQRRRSRRNMVVFNNGDARMSKYEQFHISLCTLFIAMALSCITLIVALSSEGVPSFLYLQEHK